MLESLLVWEGMFSERKPRPKADEWPMLCQLCAVVPTDSSRSEGQVSDRTCTVLQDIWPANVVLQRLIAFLL
jgi:hypothetical protein